MTSATWVTTVSTSSWVMVSGGKKRNVRKLKEMGLTESLQVGYRLSPRGRAFVDAERKRG